MDFIEGNEVMANGIVLPRHRKLLQQVKKEMRERGELKPLQGKATVKLSPKDHDGPQITPDGASD
jgi:hypothetical protein